MPTPQFILDLREHIGHAPLFLIGITAIVLRPHPDTPAPQVLLVQRSDTLEWTPIAGIVEPGEQLHEVAVREVAEETGVTARVERLVWVKTHPLMTYLNGDQASYVNHTFVMSHVEGDPQVGDDESVATGWFGLDNLPPMQPAFRERIDYAVQAPPGVRFGAGTEIFQ